LPSTAVQHDSLLFTVSPDKSVGIGWNTTTFSPVLQNASMIFPPGYVIQSSSSFSQQASSVVETTTVHYQLPQRLNQNLSSIVSSMSFNATQTGLSGQGSLRITTTTLFPVQNINVTYSTSSNRISINATAHAYFSASLYPGTPFESQTAFNNNWTATFGNQAWINNMTYQIQNTTQLLKVDAFYGNVIYSTDNLSASVSITFVGVPSGSEPDFVTAYETLIGLPTPLLTGLDNIIQSALNLSTGQTVKFTYTGSTGTIDFKSTTSYVSDLDAQVNSLKTQFFQLLFGIDPALRAMPSISFLNSTSVTVSKISMTSSLDLYAGTSSTTLNGLIIGPPTVGTNTNFTIPGLFQTLGSVPFGNARAKQHDIQLGNMDQRKQRDRTLECAFRGSAYLKLILRSATITSRNSNRSDHSGRSHSRHTTLCPETARKNARSPHPIGTGTCTRVGSQSGTAYAISNSRSGILATSLVAYPSCLTI